jgi:hypoxanthine phosphoribosyltransferase
VDDIIDTGLTLSEIKQYLNKLSPASVEFAVLLDKKMTRKILDVTPKFIGKEIHNAFVVGYGLDYNQKYRNLPYIGVLDLND